MNDLDLDSILHPDKTFLECLYRIEKDVLLSQMKELDDKMRENAQSDPFDIVLMKEHKALSQKISQLKTIYTSELFRDENSK